MADINDTTPATFADIWVAGFNKSYQAWRRATALITTNPCAKAAAASSKWLTNVQSAEAKFKASLERVSLQDWKDACQAVAIGGYQVPVKGNAHRKMELFGAKLIPKLKSIQAHIATMDSVDKPDMEARMLYYFNQMSGWDPNA